MDKIPAMTDMRRTPKEKKEVMDMNAPVMANVPDYPWGLSISMCEEELEKLGLDAEDMKVGDIYHIHALIHVTSVSSSESESSGKSSRAEFQITHMSGESEDAENVAAEKTSPDKRRSRLYRG